MRKNASQPTKKTIQRIIILLVVIFMLIFYLNFDSLAQLFSSLSHFGKNEMGLLSDNPCSIPCWQGITPGETSSREAKAIIQNSPYIREETIEFGYNMDFGGCTWNWKGHGKFQEPTISWKNGIVTQLEITTLFYFSVGDAIYRYGVPNAVNVIQGGIPESWYWIVTLYYPEKGFDLIAHTNNGSNILDASTEIGVFVLYEPKTLEERALEIGYPQKSIDSIGENSSLFFWNGYGNVIDLYGAISD